MSKVLQSQWLAITLGNLLYFAAIVFFVPPPPPPPAPAERDRNYEVPWRFHNPEVDQLIDELNKRKSTLDQREIQLNDLATRLQAERAELQAVTQTVERIRSEFETNIVRLREAEAGNLKKLAKTYATMSPEAAAAVLSKTDDENAAKVLRYMKESETASILEVMAKQGSTEVRRAAALADRLRLSVSETVTNKPQ